MKDIVKIYKKTLAWLRPTIVKVLGAGLIVIAWPLAESLAEYAVYFANTSGIVDPMVAFEEMEEIAARIELDAPEVLADSPNIKASYTIHSVIHWTSLAVASYLISSTVAYWSDKKHD